MRALVVAASLKAFRANNRNVESSIAHELATV
jgi:hypothetical protein